MLRFAPKKQPTNLSQSEAYYLPALLQLILAICQPAAAVGTGNVCGIIPTMWKRAARVAIPAPARQYRRNVERGQSALFNRRDRHARGRTVNPPRKKVSRNHKEIHVRIPLYTELIW
ncbi:hypothetical protein HD806DRAFT_527319 [Xylariaceae sp. AK1471]|nr:hypothetical protein HD806DRAFT_527319 [Xylariaceae sp. AK1471]